MGSAGYRNSHVTSAVVAGSQENGRCVLGVDVGLLSRNGCHWKLNVYRATQIVPSLSSIGRLKV